MAKLLPNAITKIVRRDYRNGISTNKIVFATQDIQLFILVEYPSPCGGK